jgi:cell division protease FtsH
MNDKKDPNASNPWMKSLLIWLGVVIDLVMFFSMFDTKTRTATGEGIPYSEFLQRVDDGSVKEVAISDNIISGTYTNDSAFRTQAPDDPRLIDRLIAKDVKFSAKPKEEPSFWMILLYQSLPFLLILGVAFFVIRQMQKNAGSGAMGFGKSKAKMLTEKHGKVTFNDVAGIDEAREELQEIVDFLKDPT